MFTEDTGMVWFRAKDISDALGLERQVIRRIDSDDKRTIKTALDKGGIQEVVFVNEPGLYQMLFASRKPEAREFKHWISHEVLPSIRKNGGYIKGQEDLDNKARETLYVKIQMLQKEVDRANRGKEKLTDYLVRTDDMLTLVFDLYRSEVRRRKAAEDELNNLKLSFSDIKHAERFVEALRQCREFDRRKEAFRTEYEKRERLESEIRKHLKASEYFESDPLVLDSYGCICRQSELITIDRT